MESLRELREYIVDHPDKGAEMLDISDRYLQMYDQMGDSFVLPKVHAFAKPVIECFPGDPKGFSLWLKQVRDTLPKGGLARSTINAIFRRVGTRALQRERRAREDAAVIVAVKLGLIPDDYATKQRYLRRLALEWGKRRMQRLEDVRRVSKAAHTSLDVQEEVLAEFWQEIEDEIGRGELPPP